MGSILKNIVSFTGLVVDVPTALPHLLNVNARAVAPHVVLPEFGSYTVTVSTTNVTVTRLAGSAAAVDVYVEHWHSYEDAEPTGGISALPFILSGGGGSGGGNIQHVEDRTLLATALPDNATTNVLGVSIGAEIGSYLQFSAIINYQNLNETTATSLVTVLLKEDGVTIATVRDVAAGVAADASFDMNSAIPLTWWLTVADIADHAYTIDVTTDPGSTGTQTAETAALFVNNLPA